MKVRKPQKMVAWPNPAQSPKGTRCSTFFWPRTIAIAPVSRSHGRSKRASDLPCRTSRKTRWYIANPPPAAASAKST